MGGNIFDAVRDAWLRVGPQVMGGPGELARRRARLGSGALRRPPRAWCVVVRANDTRITPASAALVPSYGSEPDPVDGRHYVHHVTLDARLLRQLCQPVYLEPPGEPWEQVARKLGVSPTGLTVARQQNVLRARYVQGLGGRRGKPVPLLYAAGPLDPSSPLFRPADAAWGWTATYLANGLPDEFEEVVTRVPVLVRRGSRAARANAAAPKGASRKLAPPPVDPVWYKWKDGQHVGDATDRRIAHRAERARVNRLARLAADPPPPARTSADTMSFRGWRWRCPVCNQAVRTLYLPLPPLSLDPLGPAPASPAMIERPGPGGFACVQCHRVRYFTRVGHASWNELIAHLTGGLLYGHEVPRPPTAAEARRRPYRPQVHPRPAHRRAQVLTALLRGELCRQIARDLGVSVGTVYAHLKAIYAEERVHSRRELAAQMNAPPPPPPERHPGRLADIVRRRAAGETYHQIAAALGTTWTAVHHYVRRINATRKKAVAPPERT